MLFEPDGGRLAGPVRAPVDAGIKDLLETKKPAMSAAIWRAERMINILETAASDVLFVQIVGDLILGEKSARKSNTTDMSAGDETRQRELLWIN